VFHEESLTIGGVKKVGKKFVGKGICIYICGVLEERVFMKTRILNRSAKLLPLEGVSTGVGFRYGEMPGIPRHKEKITQGGG
jgi:hypothetical protein